MITDRRTELNAIEGFAQTLPRRKRHLEYAIEEIKAEFGSRLEQAPPFASAQGDHLTCVPRAIYHNLLKSHSTSYVWRHMHPMYQISAADKGRHLRQRCIDRLRSRIASDPRLFVKIRECFMSAMDDLLSETNTQLLRAVDQCCQDVGRDLELLQGEQVPVAEDNGMLEAMWTVLDTARDALDRVIGEFEAASA
jgi:hypothetical protein